eukprot:TRINITY_DN82152_c0_g1_i1.p1 TRINITY_DN82152_c0_g1~~TRINITY_DN82152_c0_g1_i1.p1  ORF type:complete len:1033 (-),score=202.21 TRINITY_DN82152_c0_g1_i1:151-3249(-)
MTTKGIDMDLYSRQIGTFGLETMGKLIQMKVVISGLRGLGVETAKNLILAGPGAVILHDDALVEMRDLGANFFLAEADVGKKTRAEASLAKLKELNPYVAVSIHTGAITAESLEGVAVVVMSEASHSELSRINDICRAKTPQAGFIAADCFGLVGSVFVDFGDSFSCHDKDGEQPKSAIIAGITQENPGAVHTHNDKRHGFQDGDWVTFREVQGMTQINDSKPRQVKVTGPHSFTIDDTTAYSAYEREGIVTQVKVPVSMKFSSYSKAALQPKPQGGDDLPVPDLGKFGRSEQLHFAVQALRQYREKTGALPGYRDAGAASSCVDLAKELNSSASTAGALTVEAVDEDVVRKTALFARCMICPMAAFLGGVVAQEVVKFTGKYTPLFQCLYTDFFELLAKEDPADCQPTGSRYDDQIAIFGQQFQKTLADQNIFVVGAGALGCEFMKCFAMMGIGCGGSGKVTVTDMDNIEVSNLNRQFLFRKENVGKSKSVTAAAAAKVMNPGLNIHAMEMRVGAETEGTFNEDFWNGLHCVVNALDNIQARMYVDSQCVWFAKPLLESGTLGTKANVQVILPHLTQSYGDSQDPPEESFPICTLKYFPNAIEHTIEWSRDLFEERFVGNAQEVNSFLENPDDFLHKLTREGSGTTQLARLRAIRSALDRQLKAFDACVNFAVDEFQERFHDSICQLLHTFPLDHKTSEGTLFWSSPKRPPNPIRFDVADEVHLGFVTAAANLYAANLGIAGVRDEAAVAKIASSVKIADFKAKDVAFKVDDKDTTTKEGCQDDDDLVREMVQQMKSTAPQLKAAAKALEPAAFEKDDDSNFHIAFIAAAANLRARNYKIQEADFHKVKMIAGKIIPAIATTTAMATGLVSAELLKVTTYKARPIEDFKNAFVNLALPLWVLSEPMPPVKTTSKDHDPIIMGPVRAKPEGFTSWDKVEINLGDATLKTFVDYLTDEMGIEVMIMSAGNACLYNAYLPAHRKRMAEKVSKVWEDVTKQTLPANKNFLTIEVSASDPDDGVDVIIPSIKFQFR